MNQGQAPVTDAQREQEQIAMQEMGDYWKQNIPALNWSIEMTKQNEPSLEEKAMGKGAATVGAAGSNAINRIATTEPATGSSVMKMSHVGDEAAGGAGLGADAALLGQKGDYYNKELGIVGKGNDLLSKADSMLSTESGISSLQANAKAQQNASNEQAGISAGIMAAELAASFA